MSDRIRGLISIPSGFKIRTKEDAEYFLVNCVLEGSEVYFADLNNDQYVYCVERPQKDSPTQISHCRKNANPFEPSLVEIGMAAVNMAYKARRSINQRFFSGK